MTPKEIKEAQEELMAAELERRMELIGEYHSNDEDKILEMIESESKSDIS